MTAACLLRGLLLGGVVIASISSDFSYAIADDLSDAFGKARDIIRGWKPDPGPREPRERGSSRQRSQPSSSGSSGQESQRAEERRRREEEQRKERERVDGNLKILDSNLLLASSRTIARATTRRSQASGAEIAETQRQLEAVILMAPQQYGVQIEPMTVRGAEIEQRLRSARARQIHDAIINNVPLRIQVTAALPSVHAEPWPWYYRETHEEVTASQFWISEATRDGSIDPDLVRAIIWLESTHGWYDALLPVEERKTLRPMNVHASYWKGLGYAPEDLRQTDRNIATGVRILKELWRRTDQPSIEKVATLYHNLADDTVSTYGKTTAYYYQTKPWLRVTR